MSIPEVFPRTPATAAMGPKARALLATISEYDDFYGILLDVLAEARAPLDVERLARALAASFDDEGWHAVLMSDDGGVMPAPLPRAYLEAIAREYAALEEPTP